jgi:tripartite motif-containing protein 71
MVAATLASPSVAAADPVPQYVRTIGGPGHAELYPSGLDLGADGTLYVADTGSDRIVAYAQDGSRIWARGARGPKTLSQFLDPRDVAYLNGILYVADTGNGRVVLLDAASGVPLRAWNGFGSILGISAGISGSRSPIVLISQDQRNQVLAYSPDGAYIATIGAGPGAGSGQLSGPRDAATDSHGNVYVADYGNNRIAKFSPSGTWLQNWGQTGTRNGWFRRPYGVAVDAADNVYVADSNNWRIQKFTPKGAYLTSFGGRGTNTGQFEHLRRVAVGPGSAPTVYGADLWQYKVVAFDQSGSVVRMVGGAGPPDGLMNEPSGLAVDSQVFVADTVNQRMQTFDLTGALTAMWGHRGWGSDLLGFGWPRDLTANEATGTLWVADTKNDRLLEFARDGVPTGRGLGTGNIGSGPGQFYWPLGIASVAGDVVVADTKNNRVERISTAQLSVAWSATGFKQPGDVAVFGGTVYVADSLGKRVVRLDAANGSFVDSFGDTGTNPRILHQPGGVAVEPDGDVWVSDSSWNRLLEYSAAGTLKQVFGSSGTGSNQFSNPTKLEIANGLLYVADQWNDRVQVFDLGQ